MKVWWFLENEVIQDSNNIEEILPKKIRKQTEHIWSSVDASKDQSDTNFTEQEVTQLNKPDQNETTPQQL